MADGVTNLFVHESAALRYAAARPYFHPMVIERIVAFTRSTRFMRGLAVGCGTGQSARALADVCGFVEAIDVSSEMIAAAEPHDRVRYQVSPAERLPFPDQHFDLATVGSAFHWFDQAEFLREAARVLQNGAWLIIYTNGFNGEMRENPHFRKWAWEIYPQHFPTPPRRATGVSQESVSPHGFELVGSEKDANEHTMTPQQLTAYLLTQMNVIQAAQSGTLSIEQAAAWIESGVRSYFTAATGTMLFGGSIWYLRASPRA